jgi:hypothetical protein
VESSGKEDIPTYSSVNGDMKGIERIENLEEEGLYLLATCVVSYMGRRIVCQSIIPGILGFISQDSITEYGSSNRCKTVETFQEVRHAFNWIRLYIVS